MTPIQFLATINKYHFVTFVVITFVVFGIFEAIEIKWRERSAIHETTQKRN